VADWNVVVNMRVMPSDVGVDVAAVADEIRSAVDGVCSVHSVQVKPVAFGLKALELNLLFNDRVGGMDDVEAKIRRIKGVGGVETVGLNRL